MTQSVAAGFHYAGSELELFEKAVNWKSYWQSLIAPYVRGDVLEVGAGIGANVELLSSLPHRSWTCVEPDAELAAQIAPRPGRRITVGTIAEVPEHFDTILYIDVLEHIKDDCAEFAAAAEHLAPGGRAIVVSPAHSFLYSPFDASIGHIRRYSKQTLGSAAPRTLHLQTLKYIDSLGICASLANRFVLKQDMPTEVQLLAWDRLMIPASRALDRALGYRIGKSLLGVWRKQS